MSDREYTPQDVLAILERAHKMSISGPDVPEDATTYGLAAKTIRSLLTAQADLPLDPTPWVIKSFDLGHFRVSSDNPYLGYRHNFEPREGFSQDRSRYREVNDGRG